MTTDAISLRLRELISHFRLSANAFSKKVGLTSNTVLGRILNDPNRAPSYPVIKMIADTFPEVNMNWLITGRGNMIDEAATAVGHIKYFNLSGSGDMLKAVRGEIKPTSVMHIYGFKDCQYAFDVVGDSMVPRFYPGEIILCQEIPARVVYPGQPYLIIGEVYQMLRNLKTISEAAEFILSAENPIYRDLSLPSHNIEVIFTIKGRIRKEIY